MPKAPKKSKPRPANYEAKTAVKGTFLEVMQAAAKDAKNKTAKKKPDQ